MDISKINVLSPSIPDPIFVLIVYIVFALIIFFITLLIILCARSRRRQRERARKLRRRWIFKARQQNPENPYLKGKQIKQMGPARIHKKLKIPRETKTISDDSINKFSHKKKTLKFRLDKCLVYDVGSDVEEVLDDNDELIEEHTVSSDTPPSQSAYEEDFVKEVPLDEVDPKIDGSRPLESIAEFLSVTNENGSPIPAESEVSITPAMESEAWLDPANIIMSEDVLTPNTSMISTVEPKKKSTVEPKKQQQSQKNQDTYEKIATKY